MAPYICVTCATQFRESDAPPPECPVCLDPRQFVPEHGHAVLNVDLVPSRDPIAPFLPANLSDLGRTIEALSGAELMSGIDAGGHMAATPAPDRATPDVVFRTNITSTHTGFSDLMAEVFPAVPVRDGVTAHDTLLDIGKARRVLGYSSEPTWRELFEGVD